HQTKQKAIRKDGLFALRRTGARWRCAYRAYRRHLSPAGRANGVPPGVFTYNDNHKRTSGIWGTLALFLSLDGVYESLP
ncbi:hypothetical protein, partial [Pseudescherichia sp.]|uniref:hypothetical protein n=1 Tax=Pseudescherichia sp. TaxID=2055881 RepID=UPI0028AD4AC3